MKAKIWGMQTAAAPCMLCLTQVLFTSNLPKHNAALAAVPAPVGELHGQVPYRLPRVEGQRLVLTVCMYSEGNGQGKIAHVLPGAAAAAEVSQLARQSCSTRATQQVQQKLLTSGGSRKSQAQVSASRVIDGPWPCDNRYGCTRRGHRLQTSTRSRESHFGRHEEL